MPRQKVALISLTYFITLHKAFIFDCFVLAIAPVNILPEPNLFLEDNLGTKVCPSPVCSFKSLWKMVCIGLGFFSAKFGLGPVYPKSLILPGL